MTEPRQRTVACLSPAGIHRMAYTEYGAPENPNVLVCVHGLTRVGRDFERLARVLTDRYRVVCPDVVGRGRSEWLRDPSHYVLPQYVADMVTLVARLDVEAVHWVGTSMGGLIGLSLAGQPGSPITRLVLNDVGPTIDAPALVRIGEYLGKPVRFANVDQAVDYITAISLPFGLRSRDEWREITESVIRRDGDGYVLHYDPGLALPIRNLTPELAAAGEAALWKLYDNIRCPTLLTRGAASDLLSSETAAAMSQRGPRAKVVEFESVGHAPMFFHDEQISVVRDFLLNG
ncbi:MAG TPA: alpha/beta hydrolase [Burkholderiaceae bacterium]|nr:alpha/beta hydrolase [Burkholderiaceae bacterium]